MNYIGIIGDVIDSKRKYNTNKLYQDMKSGLKIINQQYSDHIAKVFDVFLGDDFQGLLHITSPICEVIDRLRAIFENIDFRFGVGVGVLSTEIDNRFSSYGSNGPVWWNAKLMVEIIKEKHENGIHSQTDLRVHGLKNIKVEQIINQSFVLMHRIRQSWTDQQRHIVNQMIINYGYAVDFKQIDAALQLGVEYKYFNKVLKATQYYDYIASMLAIQTYIQED